MSVEFNIRKVTLSENVRAILGVPEEILTDEIISSPIFAAKAEKYINKKVKDYEESELDMNLLNVSYSYYVSYLLCVGMDARLPKQMENLSTKTILQSINWIQKAEEMLAKCNEIIDDVIEAIDGEVETGSTFAVLTGTSEYPNTLI
jgi:hypothetical protein